MNVEFESRLYHCPTCDRLYYLPVNKVRPREDTERICSRCWARDMKESDVDRDPRSA